jgi:glycosyltransferase involved in cell wall biosynthesis
VTLAINAQICPHAGGGIESNLLSMLRSEFWSDSDIELALLALPVYARELSRETGHRLNVVPWPLGEEVVQTKRSTSVKRGRRIQESLGLLRPAFDAAVRIYRYVRYGFPIVQTEENIDRILRRLGIHAIHFPTSHLFRTALPFLYEPWDLQFLHFPQFFDQEEFNRRNVTYRYGCERARMVVTATRWIKDDIVARFNIDPHKIFVIRRGSEFAGADITSARYIEQLTAHGLQPGFAFYPAMTFPHKNHVTLLRALGHLRQKKRLRIPLVMSGRPYPQHWPAVQRSIEENDLGDQVRVLGPVPEETLAALYRGAHAVVFPSLFEGLGLPLLEALRHRTPVLAANTTCIPEVLGRAGILLDPLDHVAMADALERAWLDSAWLRQPLEYASEQLQLFDWGTARKGFRALYRRISGTTMSVEDDSLLREAMA